jgi:Uma2 family endonuclease
LREAPVAPASLCAFVWPRYTYVVNIALRRAMTVDEYLAWADAQSEQPHAELINGQIVSMPPERAIHNRIKHAAYFALTRPVKAAGLPCEILGDGMTVPIDAHTAYGPDGVVNCAEPIPPNQLTVPNPIIVVEVTSPSTVHSDTSAKLIGYFKLPSVAHYLVMDPDLMNVTHHARGRAPAVLTEGSLRLDPSGLDVAVADLMGTTSS